MAVLRTVSKRSQLDSYGASVLTSTSYRDANYSTESIDSGASGTNLDYQFEIQWNAPVGDTTWIHFRVQNISAGFVDGGADGWLLELDDASDNEIGRIDLLNGASAAQVIADTTVTGNYEVNSLTVYFDIEVTVTASTITMNLYMNNVFVSTASAANTVSGYGKPVKMLVEGNDTSGVAGRMYYSEFIIADENTLGWHLADLSHTSVGNYTDWANSSATTNISDDTTATSYTISSESQKFSTIYGSYNGDTEAEGFEVVSVHYHFQGASSNTNKVTAFTRIGTTDYEDEQVTLAPIGTPSLHEVIIEQNPATASAWTTTELGTLEVGLRSSS